MTAETTRRREKKFQVLVVDPPWAYASPTDRPTTAESQYPTIGFNGKEVNRRTGAGIENIAAAVPIDALASHTSAMFLWTTNPKLPFAFDLMRMWGYTYKTTLTWIKTTKAGVPTQGGLGWFFRSATEHVLVGTRGSWGIPADLRQGNTIMAPRSRHSEKPDAFYDLVEKVTPGQRRIDIFARKERAGWSVWGNEVQSVAVPV